MPQEATYTLENLPPDLPLRKGDRFFVTQHRRVFAAFSEPADVAENLAAEYETQLRQRGLRVIASVVHADWLSSTDFEIRIAFAYYGPMDPEEPDVLAASALGWVIAIGAIGTAWLLSSGWVLSEATEFSASPGVDAITDSVSLAAVAAAVVVGLIVLYLIARKG